LAALGRVSGAAAERGWTADFPKKSEPLDP
jgi:hypothetical protein